MSLAQGSAVHELPRLVKLRVLCSKNKRTHAVILTGIFFKKGMISHCFSFTVFHLEFLKFHEIRTLGNCIFLKSGPFKSGNTRNY